MHLKLSLLLRKRIQNYLSRTWVSTYNYDNCIDISAEVSNALRARKPVVALESTIISHGMPYPQNLQMALQVQDIIRDEGAVPATIAIINGRIKVGLDQDMLTEFSSLKTPAIKTSRRDFPYVLSKGLNGGTTVAGTVIVASAVGIKVFATGGLGGVHRGGEITMDVSADLVELGRNPIAVVSSGVKSILDIEKTLEYLETQGVCVITYGKTKDFPSFYTPHSGLKSPYNVETPVDAAALINKMLQLKLNSGLLLAVPIPEDQAMEGEEIERAINTAVQEAESQGVKGKDVTPFILKRVVSLTEGKSLESNIALIKNNAKVAAQVACELEKISHSLKQPSSASTDYRSVQSSSASKSSSEPPLVVVIGGSVLDSVITVKEKSIMTNGSTHRGEIKQSGGGVGRNIVDALGKLGARPFLISAVGNDHTGDYLLKSGLQHVDTRGVVRLDSHRTACYSAVVDHNGECYFGVGDMDINDTISPKLVETFLNEIQQSSLVVMDGNIPIETMDYVLNACRTLLKPVWFEPTDMRKAGKVFQCRHWTSLGYVSPNLNELQVMAQASGLFYSLSQFEGMCNEDTIVNEASFLARSLVEHIGTAVITMGRLGILIVREGEADEPLLQPVQPIPRIRSKVSVRYYPVPYSVVEQKIVNVSGAGDCLAAGMLESMLRGQSERECVSAGFVAAASSLQSSSAIPEYFPPIINHQQIEYTVIHS